MTEREPKERVLHTRVPERLEAELKDRAAEMGVSVSNLVRNVLQHALGLVNDVVADTEQIVRSARDGLQAGVRAVRGDGDEPLASSRFAGARSTASAVRSTIVVGVEPKVLGWQTVILERNALCTRCNDILPRGTDAAIAVLDGNSPAPRPISCLRCLEELRNGTRRTDP